MIVFIHARFRCDRCGDRFTVDIDPASSAADGWTPFDFAEDAVRGGVAMVHEKAGSDFGATSVQNEMHLCGTCTRIVDGQTP